MVRLFQLSLNILQLNSNFNDVIWISRVCKYLLHVAVVMLTDCLNSNVNITAIFQNASKIHNTIYRRRPLYPSWILAQLQYYVCLEATY